MKKIAMACLLVGASGMGFAQSNVQIYGVIDLGIAKGNGGSASNPGANGTNDAAQVKQASASRLGFRGTEDLGNGWTAGFLMEHRFNPDVGEKNATAPFFMQSTVSLSSKDVGTFWMGRDYIPAFWVALKADPFGMDGVGQMGLGGLMADTTSTSEVPNRTNNSVGFKSKRWNGWSADVAYSMHENEGKGAQSGMNVQYNQGALYMGLGFAKKNASPASATNDELLNLAASYDFGSFRLMGYVAQGENQLTDDKTRVYSLGADAKLGNGRVKLAYYDQHADNNVNDRKKLGIGYDYHLSKLTRVYADAGVARQKFKSTNSAFAIGIRKAF